MSKPVVLSASEWVPSKIKYMPPKVNERGGKSINMISSQTNRSLHITTPMMMTWGVADFIGDNGESDGKFSISLNFPSEEYRKPNTDAFLQKVKDFENQILDDAVRNSELWWGEEMSREVCKHTFFPFLKFSKNKDTKKVDHTKPPSIRAKVPFYSGKWGVEIYDTKDQLIFPCENEHLSPVDFIPKLSQVACVLQCGGIWIGGKGWGITWKLIQCVVKPREIVSVYGKCHIQLSVEDRDAIDTQQIAEDADEMEEDVAPPASVFKQTVAVLAPAAKPAPMSTAAPDSDDEAETEVVQATETVPVVQAKALEPEPVVAVAAEPAKKKVVKKKVVAASAV